MVVHSSSPATPTPFNVVQALKKHISHSPAHFNAVRLLATTRTPPKLDTAPRPRFTSQTFTFQSNHDSLASLIDRLPTQVQPLSEQLSSGPSAPFKSDWSSPHRLDVIPFSLEEPGRSPTGLTATIPGISGTQSEPAAGGSLVPRSSEDGHSGWHLLWSERKRWSPDTLEPVRDDGQSVLMNFSVRLDNKTYCRVPTSNGFCDYSNVNKERFLHHIRRDHLKFFPFACNGQCRSQTWYVLCLR